MCTWKPCRPSALKHGSASEPTTPLYPLNLSPHSSPRSKVASSAAKEDSMCKPAHLYAYFCDIAQNLDLLHKDLQSTTMFWKVQCALALSYKMLHLITLLKTECFIKYSYTLQGTTCFCNIASKTTTTQHQHHFSVRCIKTLHCRQSTISTPRYGMHEWKWHCKTEWESASEPPF